MSAPAGLDNVDRSRFECHQCPAGQSPASTQMSFLRPQGWHVRTDVRLPGRERQYSTPRSPPNFRIPSPKRHCYRARKLSRSSIALGSLRLSKWWGSRRCAIFATTVHVETDHHVPPLPQQRACHQFRRVDVRATGSVTVITPSSGAFYAVSRLPFIPRFSRSSRYSKPMAPSCAHTKRSIQTHSRQLAQWHRRSLLLVSESMSIPTSLKGAAISRSCRLWTLRETLLQAGCPVGRDARMLGCFPHNH